MGVENFNIILLNDFTEASKEIPVAAGTFFINHDREASVLNGLANAGKCLSLIGEEVRVCTGLCGLS